MGRLTRDAWAMRLAEDTARRATCLRRAVGAVLLDADGHVLSTGYNGVAAGMAHCNEEHVVLSPIPPVRPGQLPEPWMVGEAPRPTRIEYPHACARAAAPSGEELDGCEAIHAEQNALLQCRDVREVYACFVTTSPCVTCAKLLLNTGCRRIVFRDLYPHTQAGELWVRAGRQWEQLRAS